MALHLKHLISVLSLVAILGIEVIWNEVKAMAPEEENKDGSDEVGRAVATSLCGYHHRIIYLYGYTPLQEL